MNTTGEKLISTKMNNLKSISMTISAAFAGKRPQDLLGPGG